MAGDELKLEGLKEHYIRIIVRHKYFWLIDPKTPQYPVNRENFDKFLILMKEALYPFNTSQHGGLKVCMYCWSIVMRKRKANTVPCPVLKCLFPEYSLAEAFGKADKHPDDRYRILMNLIQYCHQEGYYPRSYENKRVSPPKKGKWKPTFPKMMLITNLKHRCHSFYVVPQIEMMENTAQIEMPKFNPSKPKFNRTKRNSGMKEYTSSSTSKGKMKWPTGFSKSRQKVTDTGEVEVDDDLPQMVSSIPNDEDSSDGEISSTVEDTDSGDDNVEEVPQEKIKVVSQNRRELSSPEIGKLPGSYSENTESLAKQDSEEEIEVSSKTKIRGGLKLEDERLEIELKDNYYLQQKEEEKFNEDANLGKRSLIESDLFKSTLALLGITDLKIVSKNRVLQIDVKQDRFFSNTPVVNRGLLQEWVYKARQHLPPKDEPSNPTYKSGSRSRCRPN